MDLLTALAFLGPLVVDGGKALIQKYLAPDEFKPTNIGDYIRMRELDVRLFESINNAGGQNVSYPWVEAVIRLMRPGVAFAVLGVWAATHLGNAPFPVESVDNFAAAIGFYLFGDRTLFYAKKGMVNK